MKTTNAAPAICRAAFLVTVSRRFPSIEKTPGIKEILNKEEELKCIFLRKVMYLLPVNSMIVLFSVRLNKARQVEYYSEIFKMTKPLFIIKCTLRQNYPMLSI